MTERAPWSLARRFHGTCLDVATVGAVRAATFMKEFSLQQRRVGQYEGNLGPRTTVSLLPAISTEAFRERLGLAAFYKVSKARNPFNTQIRNQETLTPKPPKSL